MPGDGLGEIRVLQPVGVIHIGGIGGHHIKRSRAKNLTGFPDISLHNLNLFLQAVETHASPGHIRHFPLNLQGGKMLPLRLGLQENGNDPRPRPQIQGSLQESDTYTTTQQRCKTVYDKSEKMLGYDVTYKIGDQQGKIRMDRDPGTQIPLDSNGQLILNNKV